MSPYPTHSSTNSFGPPDRRWLKSVVQVSLDCMLHDHATTAAGKSSASPGNLNPEGFPTPAEPPQKLDPHLAPPALRPAVGRAAAAVAVAAAARLGPQLLQQAVAALAAVRGAIVCTGNHDTAVRCTSRPVQYLDRRNALASSPWCGSCPCMLASSASTSESSRQNGGIVQPQQAS